MKLRDQFHLVEMALTNSELVGTAANNIFATKLITRICAPQMGFIDIGAHIGSIIYEVEQFNKTIDIIGVEAIPQKAEDLSKTFPSVEIFNCALGNQSKEVSFYINRVNSGYSSLLLPKGISDKDIIEINVSLKKLDELGEFKNIDAIKIDVEGAELGVVQGAIETISDNRPIVMFESNLHVDEKDRKALFDIFASLNYEIYLPNRLAHKGKALTAESFLDSHLHPALTGNYFSVPTERRDEFRARARRILKLE